MLKLRFSSPSIATYNDGKVTVCRYNCILFDGDAKAIQDEFRVTGTAKCAPNDNVDAEFGRKLADSRAKLAAYKIASRILSKECLQCMIEKVNQSIDLIQFIDTMNFLKKREIEHIETLAEEISNK